jgi:MarC family membrane protein
MNQTFSSVLILILLVTDPVGNIPMFVTLLQRVPPERRRRVILREVAIAYSILLGFMFFGGEFLRLLSLSETSLGIAGGLILFLIALRMIFSAGESTFGSRLEGEPFIVPLAVPFIAGPSALATVLLISSRDPQRMGEWAAALTVAMLVSAVVLSFSGKIRGWLGERGAEAVERLMGLLLTAIAVEMMLNGIRGFIRSL